MSTITPIFYQWFIDVNQRKRSWSTDPIWDVLARLLVVVTSPLFACARYLSLLFSRLVRVGRGAPNSSASWGLVFDGLFSTAWIIFKRSPRVRTFLFLGCAILKDWVASLFHGNLPQCFEVSFTFLQPVLHQRICSARDQKIAFLRSDFLTSDFHTTGKF